MDFSTHDKALTYYIVSSVEPIENRMKMMVLILFILNRIKNHDLNHFISVPLSVFVNLHGTFDRGAVIAHSGKKDGTDRSLTRLKTLAIVDINSNGEVLPFEVLMALTPNQKLSNFMQVQKDKYEKTGDSTVNWVYNDKRELIGIKDKDGKILTKDKFD